MAHDVQETWGTVFHALQILVTYYQSILPGQRHSLSSQSPMALSSTFSKGEGHFNYLTYDQDPVQSQSSTTVQQQRSGHDNRRRSSTRALREGTLAVDACAGAGATGSGSGRKTPTGPPDMSSSSLSRSGTAESAQFADITSLMRAGGHPPATTAALTRAGPA